METYTANINGKKQIVDVDLIKKLIDNNPRWHRGRLSKELCKIWAWSSPMGQLKDMARGTLLLRMARKDLLTLPKLRRTPTNALRNQKILKVPHSVQSIHADIRSLLPIQLSVVEFPIIISEHYVYPVWCENCQKCHKVKLPEKIVKAGLFGEKMTTLVAYLKNVCHCSYSTIARFFADVYQVNVSRGYLAKVIQKVSLAPHLKPSYEELLNLLPLEGVVFADETGHKNNGDLFWTWVFRTDLYILFKIDPSRGSKVLIEVRRRRFQWCSQL